MSDREGQQARGQRKRGVDDRRGLARPSDKCPAASRIGRPQTKLDRATDQQVFS